MERLGKASHREDIQRQGPKWPCLFYAHFITVIVNYRS